MKPLIGALLLTAGIGAAGLAYQPGSRPPPPRPRQEQPAQPVEDRAAMRARLERRLSEIDRLRDRVQEAIEKLDKGEPVESVRGEIFPPGAREGGRDRGPDGRDGRGPDGRGDRPPRGEGRGDEPPPPFVGPPDPDADRKLVLTFLKEHDPAGAKRMEDVLRDRPEDGARWVGRSAVRIRAILDERDEALRALRLKEYLIGRRAVDATRRLGDALASPGHEADAAAARNDLGEVLGEQFDIRMSVAQREIQVLEERVKRLRGDLTDQEGKRQQFIDTRTEELITATREWAERERAGGGGNPPPRQRPQR